MIEARRFKSDTAAMVVHSFSPARTWFNDYAAFVALFGHDAKPDQLICIRPGSTPPLYLGWATGPDRFLLGE
jgi:hypothetical protein